MPSQQNISPQRSLSGNLKINPFFLPTARPHPLKPLTRGPPSMYWLGTSRRCLGPLCMLYSTWVCFVLAFTLFLLSPCLFDSALRTGWSLSFVVWRMCGLLGSCSLPFILSWTGRYWAKALFFLPSPCFPLLCPWAFWLLILPYHFIVPAIALPSFLLRITLWTCGLMFLPCQPTSSAIFYSGLPWPTFHIFTSFGLY